MVQSLKLFTIVNTPVNYILLGAALISGLRILSTDSGMDSAAVLWFLAVSIAYYTQKDRVKKYKLWSCTVAWLLIALAFWLSLTANKNLCIFIIFCSLVAYFGNLLILLKTAVCGFLLFVIIPNTSELHTLLSSPLSKICALFASIFLNAVGIHNTVDEAIIRIGDNQIAVTAACSGIELLEAMLLLGWFVVIFSHEKFYQKILHYLVMFPLIVVFNTLRLIAVIALSLKIGDQAFHEPLHSIFGYTVVILTATTLYSIGHLFHWDQPPPQPQSPPGHKPEHASMMEQPQ